jgi:YHS domain-containing protein
MDPLRTIRDDHDEIRTLIDSYPSTASEAGKQDYRRRLITAIEAHARLEEAAFYPWVRDQGMGESWVDVSVEEHHAVDVILKEFGGLDLGDKGFGAKLMVLKQMLELHMGKEERQIMEYAMNAPPDAMADLSRRLGEHRPLAMHAASDTARRFDTFVADEPVSAGNGHGALTSTSSAEGMAGYTAHEHAVIQAIEAAVRQAGGVANLEVTAVEVHKLDGSTEPTIRFTADERASADIERSRIADSGESVDVFANQVVTELGRQLSVADGEAHEAREQAGSDQMAHDPVCHMDIRLDDAFGRSTHDGLTFYFCSEGCQHKFEMDPAGVIEAESRQHATAGAR